MALFCVLKNEKTVQVDDQTRLDARSSYANAGDAITQVEIDPGDGTYIDVTSDRYLDTQYETDGDKTLRVRLNATEEKSFSLSVITEANDALFVDDSKLEVHEPDLLRYVRDGRNSYKDVHRRVQALILDWLDSNRFWKNNGDRFVIADLIDQQDFKEWATFWALQLIFQGLSDKLDDKWDQKADVYRQMAFDARERGTYRLDKNDDGELTVGEKTDNSSKGLIRI